MASRDVILARLRESAPATAPARPPSVADREIFTGDVEGGEALVEQFTLRLTKLKGEVCRVADEAEAATKVFELLESSEDGPWLSQRAPLLDEVFQHDSRFRERVGLDRLGDSSVDLAKYSVGVSVCDCLVSRTGSVVLGSHTAGGRRLSVLPPLHIVVARVDQLVLSLDAALAVLGQSADWSYATIITGPSRTADIEKILVLGAHGPKRLAVVIIG